MSLVIYYHDVLEPREVFYLSATKRPAVEHAKVVARRLSRANRQQLLYDLRNGHLSFFLLIIVCQLVFKQVPVGQCYHSVASCLSSYSLLLCHHIILNERENFLTKMHWYEYVLVQHEIVCIKVPVFRTSFDTSTEGIKQSVINYESRSHYKEVLRESSARFVLMSGIKHLPKQHGVHHPCLTGSCCHLYGIFRYLVFCFGKCSQVGLRYKVIANEIVCISNCIYLRHFMQINDIQYRLTLAFMEIALSDGALLFREPPFQQFLGCWSDRFEHRAVSPCVVDYFCQSLCHFKRQFICVHHLANLFIVYASITT